MINREIKQCIGQLIHGVQVVGAHHGGVNRLYTSHWVTQVSFDEPIVMASVSPKHDTYPLMVAAGEFSVSLLAADQVVEAQYFSYPGHKLRHVADEFVRNWPHESTRPESVLAIDSDVTGPPIVADAIAWLRCETFQVVAMRDHELFFARVIDVVSNRLRDRPLLYSSRLGWRTTGERAREPEMRVRDTLLERLSAD